MIISNLSTIKCFNCGTIGHMKRDCTSASKSRKVDRKFKNVGESNLAMNSVSEQPAIWACNSGASQHMRAIKTISVLINNLQLQYI